MLKDLFEFLYGRAEAAVTAKAIEIGDIRQKHFLLKGEHFSIDVPPEPRKHVIFSLADLLAAASQYGSAGTLWHDRKAVTLLIDDADRRERITMPLVTSQQFELVASLGQPLDQAAFVKLLKNQLAGCVPDTLRPAVSKIEIATSNGQKNEINPGRERGSREFAVDVVSGGEIPEFFHASVSVYANPGLRTKRSIKLSLDYTLPPAQVTFAVKPLPDEIEIAWQDAQLELHKLLCESVEIPVFEGTP